MDRIRLMTLGVTLAMTAYTIGMPAFSAPEQGKKAESKPAETTEKAKEAWSKPVDEPTDAELKNKKDRLRLKGLRSSIPNVEVTQPPKTQSVLPNNTKSAEIKAITISRPVNRTPSKTTIKKSANPGEVLYDKKKGGREMFIAKPVTAAQTHKVAVRPVANQGGVFSASLNKGGNQPAYKHGEKMQINVTANQDCNLNIFNFDGHKLVQIFPNDFQKDASVKAGETIEIGGPDSEFDYQASLPKGTKKSDERIFVYAYPINDAPISVALNHMENAPFRDAEISIEQYRDLINQAKTKHMKERDIQIVSKKKHSNVQLTSDTSSQAPTNTVEMPFSIVER